MVKMNTLLDESTNSATSKVKARGLKRINNAFVYSLQGLRAAFEHEEAFRQETVLALLMIPSALWLAQDAIERVLLIGSVVLVLIVELLNSGIEAVVDCASPEFNELAGRAKDLGSAAVFLALLLAGYVWLDIVALRFF